MPLLHIPPCRILGRFIPISLPPTGTFAGNTVLIIGGTAGLGLAAAIHVARLGSNVIITGLQVNAISTALLGLLLLAWMREGRAARISPAHMIFVTSRDHLYPSITDWATWAKQEGGILGHVSNRANWPAWWETTMPNYANSKLLVMYAVAEISKLARDANGEPDVIVDSIFPGLVNTNIGHSISQTSLAIKVSVPIYLKILGKTPDSGARHCLSAALKPSDSHGEFSNPWLTTEQYRKKAVRNMTSTTGREIQAWVWEELVTELTTKVTGLQVKRHYVSG